MSGFEKQRYTQTPNTLFEIMKDMDECELKVVLYICRMAFGFHRAEIKLSTRHIAEAIGMNTASVDKGADAAVARGLIERVVDGNKTTLWRVVVSDSEIESPAIQKLNRHDSDNESLLGVKESKKEKVKNEYVLKPEDIRNAIRDHFKLTPNWKAKDGWDFMEFAFAEGVTVEQISRAANVFAENKKFNWRQPSLKVIMEQWLSLVEASASHKTDEERPEYKPFVPQPEEGFIPNPYQRKK